MEIRKASGMIFGFSPPLQKSIMKSQSYSAVVIYSLLFL